MRIGIIGAGAIGCVVGGLLTKAGHDVTLVDQWPEHVETMKQRGLRLSGTCGEHTIPNTASFVTNDTGATGSSSASVNVTVVCEPPSGCTRTIGYWKTHAGFGPQADVVTALLPVWLGTAGGAKSVNVTTAALAVQLLDRRGSNNVADSSNGINKLYAQLLGAKLNGEAGANLSSVASVIAAADAFLANNNSLNWAGLTDAQKSMVNGWATTLDNYNNGLVGPEHCD